MADELTLTDFIDVETLQEMQDAFCRMTGIPAGIADANGVAVTKGTISCDFCANITKGSPKGLERCEQCDKRGGELAMAKGSYVCYKCHTGLTDFAAPITAGGQIIGSFLGGQVRTEEIDEPYLRKVAAEIDVDPDLYVEAARKTQLVDQQTLDNAARFLYTMTNILSKISYHSYMAHKASMEIERAAQMKSDFLANMSHEIRTPMNAVIGMTEMALREDLSPSAKDYISQIKASGKTLLSIINDILDFSKIESGKMDINNAEYAPMSIINDVANTIIMRLQGKNVELLFDITPDIPYELIGDSIRIKQILINIANNAAKFTTEGHIKIKMDYERTSESEILLRLSVTDTGIGIKKEDLPKLFQSFSQLDSKRNRNIEGTGLGLAIVQRLLTLMNGDINVTSVYGEGSTFSVAFPQHINNGKPSICLKNQDRITAAGLIDNLDVKKQLQLDINRLGAVYIDMLSMDDIQLITSNHVDYLFIEQAMFTDALENWVREHPDVTCVLMTGFTDNKKYDIPNLKVVRKPLYSLNIATIFNNEDLHLDFDASHDEAFKFVAPDADILIVDDNAINLTVAEGLLEPMKMRIDTACSGMECISKISVKHYDLIFMDHMMPELDGVETTHIIRRFHHEYNDVPIVALTANAVDGTKDMFLNEGMNDFVPKPIEMRVITAVLKRWLPPEKIQKLTLVHSGHDTEGAAPAAEPKLKIEGLNTDAALKLLGSQKLFLNVLKDYYHVIDKKAKLIKEYEVSENWPSYTIEVHALKSASKQIGAMELSAIAADMEKAGNARNKALIHMTTDSMLELYTSYKDVLAPYFPEEVIDESEKQDADYATMHRLFHSINEALDNLDMDQMEEATNELKKYRYDEAGQALLQKLLDAAEEWDVDSCMNIITEWAGII